jgi:hypothetical protein
MAEPSDYEGYDDLVRLGRSLSPDDRERFAPPFDLWQKIERAAAADDDATVVSISDRPQTRTSPRTSTRARRIWAAVVAAGVAACLVIGIAVARDAGGASTLEEVALSNAGLDAAGASTSGRAKLVQLDGGSRAIDLDVSGLPQVDNGYFELWVIDRQLKGMVSLGPVRGSGRYVIPAGVATDAFPIVDLSIEPVDGVPTHSGKSVLRGELA